MWDVADAVGSESLSMECRAFSVAHFGETVGHARTCPQHVAHLCDTLS